MTDHHHPWTALCANSNALSGLQALRFPHTDTNVTFEAWHDASCALAKALIDLGVNQGEHVALLAENRAEWAVVQMAVAAAGAVFTPLNTHYRRDDLVEALNQSAARIILTSSEFRSNAYLQTLHEARADLRHLERIIVIGSRHDGCESYDDLIERGGHSTARLPQADPDAAGALLYTSGTTGTPKGAVLTHRAMMMNARETARRLGIIEGDRWTSIIPLFHCAGCIMNIQGGLQAGACYVGLPAFDPVTMFDTIETERCTVLSGVPTSFLAMLDHPQRRDFDLSSLRTGTCGGADCNGEMLQRCAEAFPIPQVCQVYGQTESATLVACPQSDDPERFTTAGQPLEGYDVRIIDPEAGDYLQPGEIGEIQARGPMVMLGYHNCPVATAETIIEDGWLRTGDLGYLSESGHLVVAGGRLRDMIIRGGENIYPVEIENLLQEHSSVENVAVFGLPDDYYGECVAAAVVTTTPTTLAELRSFCAGRIAGFKVPVQIYEAREFPLTPSGKVRKTELRELVRAGALSALP